LSERERSRVGPVPEDAGAAEKPNPGGDPADFLRLVKQATGASGDDKQQLVGELIDVLIAMRAPGNERAEARAVLSQLDLKSLRGMVDGQGRSARAEAVETVMSLGFPYALALAPEDFSYARSVGARDDALQAGLPALQKARLAATGLALTSAALQVGVLAKGGFDDINPVLLGWAVATAGWGLWVRSRLRSAKRELMTGAAGMAVAIATGTALLATSAPLGLQLIAPLLPAIGAISLFATSRRTLPERNPRE